MEVAVGKIYAATTPAQNVLRSGTDSGAGDRI